MKSKILQRLIKSLSIGIVVIFIPILTYLLVFNPPDPINCYLIFWPFGLIFLFAFTFMMAIIFWLINGSVYYIIKGETDFENSSFETIEWIINKYKIELWIK